MWVIPDFGIWGIFLQGEKSWGAKICTSFGIEFFAVESGKSYYRYVLSLVADLCHNVVKS